METLCGIGMAAEANRAVLNMNRIDIVNKGKKSKKETAF
jgi:hypothetical protein